MSNMTDIKYKPDHLVENFIVIIPLDCEFDIGYGIINKTKNIISLDNKYTLLNGIVIDIDESKKNIDLLTIIGLKSNIMIQMPISNFKHKILENLSEDPMWNISQNINKHNL